MTWIKDNDTLGPAYGPAYIYHDHEGGCDEGCDQTKCKPCGRDIPDTEKRLWRKVNNGTNSPYNVVICSKCLNELAILSDIPREKVRSEMTAEEM